MLPTRRILRTGKGIAKPMNSITSSRSRAVLAALVGVAVLAIVVPFLSGSAIPDSDEGHHILLGLKYRDDLSHLDLVPMLRHTVRSGRYPFLHGWYVGSLMTLLGGSFMVARLSSALLFAGAAAIAALLVLRLRPSAGLVWGALAAGFVAFAPENFSNALLCMLEVPGLFLGLLLAWLYACRLSRPESALRASAVGAVLCALLFVKYPYGAYGIVPVGLAELARARGRVFALFRWRSVLAWAPPLACLAIWIVLPQSRQGLKDLFADDPQSVRMAGEAAASSSIPYVQPGLVLFYLATTVKLLSPGVLLGVLGLAGFAWFCLTDRSAMTAFFLGGLLWTILTLTLSYRAYGVDRFLVPAAGWFVVPAVAGLHDLQRRLALGKRTRLLVPSAIGVGAIGAFLYLPSPTRLAHLAVETGPLERAAATWAVDSVEYPSNLFVVGAWDQFSEAGIESVGLVRRPELRYSDFDVKGMKISRTWTGIGGFRDWLAGRNQMEGGGERHRYVLLVTVAVALPDAVDPGGFDRVLESAREELASSDAELLSTYQDRVAQYELFLVR